MKHEFQLLTKVKILSSLFIAVIIILEVDYEKDVRNVKNYHAWLPGPHRNMWATAKSKWLCHWALHLPHWNNTVLTETDLKNKPGTKSALG